jgi:hypothetical protein
MLQSINEFRSNGEHNATTTILWGVRKLHIDGR